MTNFMIKSTNDQIEKLSVSALRSKINHQQLGTTLPQTDLQHETVKHAHKTDRNVTWK